MALILCTRDGSGPTGCCAGSAALERSSSLQCAALPWLEQKAAEKQAPKKRGARGNRGLKKISARIHELTKVFHNSKRVRLMFQDETGFGRINKSKRYWCRKGVRPRVPCHHIRQYRYVYGAINPVSGDSCFLILPYCNTVCMNLFLEHLSAEYPNDYIVLVCDGAAWHKSGSLKSLPDIEILFIPPYTPEMNPIEQIWEELRARGFHNEVFQILEKVVDRLCDTICNLSSDTIRRITGRNWIVGCFI